MAIDVGSMTAGRLDLGGAWIDEVIMNIQAGLDAVNDKTDAYEYKLDDLGLIMPYVKQFQGPNNYVLAYEDFEVFFQDYAEFIDPIEYNESENTWTLKSKSYAAKNGSFTPSFIKDALKAGQDPNRKILERTQAILKKYNNVFKPNFVWEAVLTVPTSGGTYYEKFGALNAVVVKKSMIKDYDSGASAGAKGSLTRTHFRGIVGSSVGTDDIKWVKEYMNEYVDVNTNDLRMLGNLTTKHELESVFADNVTKDNITLGNIDVEVDAIYGMPFMKTNMLPDNIIMFYVADTEAPLVAELVSNIDMFTGLRFENEKSYEKFNRLETMDDLFNGRFVIEDIGEHLIGRHRVLFLDITPSRYTTNTTRAINVLATTALTNQKKYLRTQWWKTVNHAM